MKIILFVFVVSCMVILKAYPLRDSDFSFFKNEKTKQDFQSLYSNIFPHNEIQTLEFSEPKTGAKVDEPSNIKFEPKWKIRKATRTWSYHSTTGPPPRTTTWSTSTLPTSTTTWPPTTTPRPTSPTTWPPPSTTTWLPSTTTWSTSTLPTSTTTWPTSTLPTSTTTWPPTTTPRSTSPTTWPTRTTTNTTTYSPMTSSKESPKKENHYFEKGTHILAPFAAELINNIKNFEGKQDVEQINEIAYNFGSKAEDLEKTFKSL